ncbi:uncharacterized protein Dana_GF20599 [Drosophila ananassae]|uniref:Uncharacterized protein n=1 Tax=Drosophila ananassae TaxID=7217 RepID=B3N1Y6_DROAN|nr:probable cytochrome P450 309a2 [Drosophila ananassae]EDV30596.2 uncharacterized protein Dana_GF20599 [Drosophila ananassae]
MLPIYLYLTWNHKYWSKRGLTTARPLTVLGTYPGLLTRKSNLVIDIQKIYDKYKGKHRAVGVFVTRQPQILILDPELAHDVLVGNYRCFKDSLTSSYIRHAKQDKYARLNPFWASGESWRRLRSEAQAGLSGVRLKHAYAIWKQGGKMLIYYIAQQVDHNNILETRDLCFRYTAQVMADFIWGIDAGTLSRPKQPNKIQEMATKWTSYAFYMISWFMATIVAPAIRLLLQFRFFPKDTDEFFSNLTKESIEMRLKGSENSSRTDYLSHLLQLREQKQATHDDLVGHALTVLLDGYDTTGTALLHALYYLAESPAAQKKLRTELLSSVDAERSIDFDKLCALPYLEQVVYESLRLSSIVPQYTKVCTTPTDIKLSETKNVRVEKGMTIMIPNYQFHHDRQYFRDPEVFRPERFDNSAYQELMRKGIFLPFSDGPRVCMGIRLALLTLKSALFYIMCDFEVVRRSERLIPKGDSGFGVLLQGDINLEYRRVFQ